VLLRLGSREHMHATPAEAGIQEHVLPENARSA
jgi:hypothetical protein